MKNRVVCYSPPKSVNFKSFVELYPNVNKDIVCQEFVEGTMVNVFWDSDACLWEISTKNTVGATSKFYKKQGGKTFRTMFFEALSESGLSISDLDQNYRYSFVLQHPENRIVVRFAKPSLYLVAIYGIEYVNNSNNSTDIIVYNHDIYDFKAKQFFSKTKICFPKLYTTETYSNLISKYA
jgi:hypothetical protein